MTGGCCEDSEHDACECPSGFVRVRYYFGQRIGVPEMTDATRYGIGKQRFANVRLHGAGLLCGMRAVRVPEEPLTGQVTVALKITAGAGLDGCGREVVVGSDQCINVAAWFVTNRTKAPYRDWKAGETHTLWVAVRYRECPTDPALAPRDPCGCDTGGCEFGRIMEGFELSLFSSLDDLVAVKPAAPTELHPPFAAGAAVPATCAPTDPGAWLVLARFDATLGDVGGTVTITGIGAPNNDIPQRVNLLSTQALQALLLALAGSAAVNPFAPGPRFGALALDSATQLVLALDGVTDPIAAGTFDPAHVKLRRFEGGKWAEVKQKAELQPGRIVVTLLPGPLPSFKDAENYRLVYAPPLEAPLTDSAARSVGPNPLARQFRTKKTATGWVAVEQ